MLSIRIDHVVAQIVRSELQSKPKKDQALYMSFDLSMQHFDNYPKEYKQRCGLHLLYYCPYGGYITVFSGITESPFADIKKVSWKFETCHDSCWRDIHVFSDVYFGMAQKINDALEKDGYKTVAPKDMNEYNSMGGLFSDELYRWVDVRVSKDPSDENNHKKLVEII